MQQDNSNSDYIQSLTLNDAGVLRRSPHIEQERQVALADLLRQNYFSPVGLEGKGPFELMLGITDNRMVMDIKTLSTPEIQDQVKLPIAAFRSIIKDYFLICESYFDALKTADPYKLEAIDMGRRGVHNEGSELLKKLLAEKAAIDFDTARRLFTLICVLHIR